MPVDIIARDFEFRGARITLILVPTERLYYPDCYLREFDARVVETADDGRRVYLDRTAFYPTSGGQLFDLGWMNGIAVTEVVEESDRIAHVLGEPLRSAVVRGEIDWARRYDLMQQHSGQHLLSAVFEELFQFATVSVHMGAETSTVDLQTSSVSSQQLEQAELRCTELVGEARPITIHFEDAATATGLRKESARTGMLRIAEITGVDRSACGGTHVRNSAEIGPVLTGKLDKVRGITRVEFACGQRALQRARTDYQLMAALCRALSTAPEDLLPMVRGLSEKNKALEKDRLTLANELAKRAGRDLYLATPPDATGTRRVEHRGVIDEAVRVQAQSFVAGEKAIFLAICEDPPSALLAASTDSGVHAGNIMKAAVTAVGGRGGGNAMLAQGSVPDATVLAAFLSPLREILL